MILFVMKDRTKAAVNKVFRANSNFRQVLVGTLILERKLYDEQSQLG